MKKTIGLFCALFLTAAVPVWAATVPDENAAKALADNVMAKVGVGDLDAAFTLMKPYVPLSETELNSAALQSKSQREQFGKRFGDTVGFEFIDSQKIGGGLLRFRYLEKTQLHALPWVFYFYRAANVRSAYEVP